MKSIAEDGRSARDLLDKEFTAIMIEYVTKVSSRYRGNEFTSSQLAKTILAKAEMERTRFPIVHRIVKDILKVWEEQGLCHHIATTKYSRCRKTKDTYRFKKQGIKEIKKRAIEETIRTIGEGELRESPIMRPREVIIKDRLEELISSMPMANNQASQEDV
jgi:hypothetical protein